MMHSGQKSGPKCGRHSAQSTHRRGSPTIMPRTWCLRAHWFCGETLLNYNAMQKNVYELLLAKEAELVARTRENRGRSRLLDRRGLTGAGDGRKTADLQKQPNTLKDFQCLHPSRAEIFLPWPVVRARC